MTSLDYSTVQYFVTSLSCFDFCSDIFRCMGYSLYNSVMGGQYSLHKIFISFFHHHFVLLRDTEYESKFKLSRQPHRTCKKLNAFEFLYNSHRTLLLLSLRNLTHWVSQAKNYRVLQCLFSKFDFQSM